MSKQLERIKPEQLKSDAVNILKTEHGGYSYTAEVTRSVYDEWNVCVFIVAGNSRYLEFQRFYKTAKAALKKLKEYWKGDAVEWRLL